MNLRHNITRLAKQAGGSKKTVHDRIAIMERFFQYLRQSNIQTRSVEHLKGRHIVGYVHSRLAADISKRTVQNEMSAIRCVLEQAGRIKLADSEQLSNRTLGIGGASREGTRTAISDEQYKQVLHTAQEKDAGLAAAIRLARVLGLRGEEAVQSAQSLQTWKKELEQGKTHLTVVFGTKGGRPRQSRILNQPEVQQAVHNALTIANDRNGRLIDKPNLKEAMSYWRHQTTVLGLKGQISPHSLRYAWAQDAVRYYLEQGFSEKEALALTSMDLGHGDGRGRYVKRVYGL